MGTELKKAMAKAILSAAACLGLIVALAGASAAGEGGMGKGPEARGRSGEVDRNQDPRGPHAGQTHRNGQVDQGWHGGKGGGGDAEADDHQGEGDGKGGHGFCKRWHRCKRFHEWLRNLPPEKRQDLGEKLRERFEALTPEEREELKARIRERLQNMREHFENLPPEKREEIRERLRERFQNMPPEKREELKDKAKEHWDRGLHRGADGEKPQGGGGFGRDRQKWNDYGGKPGNGNDAPKGPKGPGGRGA